MPLLHVTNARVIDPAAKRDEASGELFIQDGVFVARPSAAALKKARRIDAAGLVAAPGLVDVHVHFREPGQTHKETIETGSRAAAAGGFTSVVCMPNTAPVADNAGTIQLIKDSAARSACIHIYPTGCITVGMKGQALAPIGSLKRAGVVAITDDGDCVQSNELMRRACEYSKMFGLPLMDHCQDHSMTVGAVMNEGAMSVKLGLKGWPNAAEDLIVARNCILSEYTGAHIHMQHVSSRNAVDILRRAKARGVKVTGEACPHHFAFTDERLATYDTHFKMNPPLRTEEDRLAVIAGLKDGTLDILATDHAPHTPDEKEREFDHAPNGILGLETALAVSLDILVRQNKFKLATLVDLWTRKPAQLLGLPAGTLAEGAPADLVLFNPDEEWTYDAKAGFSKSANSPWSGQKLRGRVRQTFVSGKLVFANGKIL
ncbi:MAG: dihydroorotase [Burkholderiales bacterium]|nr:dihydroorotase [Opitutaceae bacterium]